MALPVQPVAECPDGAVVSILTIVAVEIAKEEIDVGRREVIVGNEWLEASFVELSCAW